MSSSSFSLQSLFSAAFPNLHRARRMANCWPENRFIFAILLKIHMVTTSFPIREAALMLWASHTPMHRGGNLKIRSGITPVLKQVTVLLFLSFFLQRVLVIVHAFLIRSPNFFLLPQWQTFCQRRGLCRYSGAWGEIFFPILIIPNNGAHTGTEMGHKWIIYFVFVCILTPLLLHSIFRCHKEAFHYCVFDKVLSESSSWDALSGEINPQKLRNIWCGTEFYSKK